MQSTDKLNKNKEEIMFSKSYTTIPIHIMPAQRHTEIQEKEKWKLSE
jgi:hypothetical protein